MALSLKKLAMIVGLMGKKRKQTFAGDASGGISGETGNLHPELIRRLNKLQRRLGRSITVHSGYRSPAVNRRVGGASKSKHMYGLAVDISVPGLSPRQVAAIAAQLGFGGIGIYGDFTHIDVRDVQGESARW